MMASRICAAAVVVILGAVVAHAAAGPVKVFVLAGQSNMEGKAKVALADYQATRPSTRAEFAPLRTKDGAGWAQRDDVWVKFLEREGKLTVGFGSPKCIGPELGFGTIVGDRFEEPVLLIKTAWGGRSLYRDFRSPGAGLPAAAVLEKMLATQKAKKPATTIEDVKAPFGASYRAMLAEVDATLKDLKAHVPGYDPAQGYELAGFVWFQGWNDMIDDAATAEYAVNMAHFIRDVRRDLKAPKLPFVIGQMGVGGDNPDAKVRKFKDAQAAVIEVAEFKGNVALVRTDVLWDAEADAVFKKGWRQNIAEWNTVGSDFPFHYLGSARTMLKIGRAMGEAALALRSEGK